METRTVLQLSFKTTTGKTRSINILDPKEDLTETQVSQAMDTILNNGIFTTTAGDFADKVSATIITTTREDLYEEE